MNEEKDLRDAAFQDWLKARKIIKTLLKELCPTMSNEALDHNAAALIARLAHENMTIDTVKEE